MNRSKHWIASTNQQATGMGTDVEHVGAWGWRGVYWTEIARSGLGGLLEIGKTFVNLLPGHDDINTINRS